MKPDRRGRRIRERAEARAARQAGRMAQQLSMDCLALALHDIGFGKIRISRVLAKYMNHWYYYTNGNLFAGPNSGKRELEQSYKLRRELDGELRKIWRKGMDPFEIRYRLKPEENVE